MQGEKLTPNGKAGSVGWEGGGRGSGWNRGEQRSRTFLMSHVTKLLARSPASIKIRVQRRRWLAVEMELM